MNKLVGVLAVVVACLLAASPAWSARSGTRTSFKVTSSKAPVTVYVVLCDNTACETGGQLCPGVDVIDVLKTERGTCTTPFAPQGLRKYAYGPAEVPPSEPPDGPQASYVNVSVRF